MRKVHAGALVAALAVCVSWSVAGHAETRFSLLTLKGATARWAPDAPGHAVSLRYAFTSEFNRDAEGVNCRAMISADGLRNSMGISEATFAAIAKSAFARWAAVTGIEFEAVADAGTAHIVIGAMAEPMGFAFTNVSTTRNTSGAIAEIHAARICLNPDRRWKVGYDGDFSVYDLEHTLMHEIGHALGLDHPVDRSQVMSFRYHESNSGLSPGDIAGARALYANALDPTVPAANTNVQGVSTSYRQPPSEKALGMEKRPQQQ